MRFQFDGGYNTSKMIGDNGTGKFLSSIKERTSELEKADYILEYKGIEYLIGTPEGRTSNQQSRVGDEVFDLCLYTGIAANMKTNVDHNVRIITGLPNKYFKNQKDDLINSLVDREVKVKLNGEEKHFTIKKVVVFPQSAGLFLYDEELVKDDTLVGDIGGGTFDVSYMHDGKFKGGKTYPLGVNALYDNLLQELTKYNVNYSNRMKASEIIKRGYIKVKGKKIDVSDDIDNVFKKHAKAIIDAIEGGFTEQFQYSDVIFIGGGSILLEQYLAAYIILPDADFINVKIFKIIGDLKHV